MSDCLCVMSRLRCWQWGTSAILRFSACKRTTFGYASHLPIALVAVLCLLFVFTSFWAVTTLRRFANASKVFRCIDVASFVQNGTLALEFGNVPELQQSLVVVGFPTGGDNLCVTAGVVSRVDVHEYAHSGFSLCESGAASPCMCPSRNHTMHAVTSVECFLLVHDPARGAMTHEKIGTGACGC